MSPSPPPALAPRKPPLVILIAVSSLNPLALNIFVPSMPGLETAFQTSYARVQLALSLYLAAVAVAQLVLGPLSDRYGRRPVMLAGMVMFLVGTIVCRFSESIEIFILGRIVQGVGSCAGLALSRAIVRDLYDRDQAASMIGFVTMGMAVAPMIGPAIGGALDDRFGWQATFDLLFAFGFVVTVGTLLLLHETHHERIATGPGALWRSFAALLREPLFLAYATSSALTSGVFFAFLGGAPYVVQKLMGLGAQETGFYFILVAGGYMFGNFLSGRYAALLGVVRMTGLGNALALATGVAVLGLHAAGVMHPLAVFGPMFVIGIANGVSLPSSVAGAVSVRPDLAGAASGLVGSMQIGGGAVVTVTVGALLNDSAAPLYLAMLTLAAGALLAGLAASRMTDR